ncbi:MAG: Rossmann-like and DUF2520 domain-containing protein [Acidimicrobiia bacterium]
MHEPTPSPSLPARPHRGSAKPRSVAIVGPGRAGRAVGAALQRAGWSIVAVSGRGAEAASTVAAASELGTVAREVDDLGSAAEIVILATPDGVIAAGAEAVVGSVAPGALVVHLAGSRGLEVFGVAAGRRPDVRFAALHPLVSIPTPDPAHLRSGWCAVAGEPDVYGLASALGLQPFTIAAGERARYHATATIAANHLVALMGQVERLARLAGVPRDAFYPLIRGVLDNCELIGPREALTGPVMRGDTETVDAHLAALPPEERDLYRALAAEALRLSGRHDPELVARLR